MISKVTKKELYLILEALDFVCELDAIDIATKGYSRFRHKAAPQYDKEFAYIVYHDWTILENIGTIDTYLIKLGRYLKSKEITEYL